MAVHDNLYKMEEYAVHASAEAYVGTIGDVMTSSLACLCKADALSLKKLWEQLALGDYPAAC